MPETIEQVRLAFTTYAVERELGRGGMATVYLAYDKKHDRKVAIKILHAELTAMLGGERFLQEIRLTANLQHPHILGLIDSGLIGDVTSELHGRAYYVMPYVDGQSLRQRLDTEKQLPVLDCVRIATEVASALDYAHRQAVIHRDIKPENILLHDGSAIVADFGIALAVTAAGGMRMTQSGMSLGTPRYMSPEQALAQRSISGQSDIYSLGVVTYEMLAGEPPFTGPNAQAIAVRSMIEEPLSLATVRKSVPPQVAAAVARALEHVPADRFASAHEFAEALRDPPVIPSPALVVGRDPFTRHLWSALYVTVALAILTTAAMPWRWVHHTESKRVVRYSLVLDSTEAMAPGTPWSGRVVISPDGSHLAYIGGSRSMLLIRARNQLHAVAVPRTEGASSPFFSPDGKRVGFLMEKNVQVAPVNGGRPITVADSLTGVAGASWGPDDFIYVDGFRAASLVRVEAKPGAVPNWFTMLDTAKGEFDHSWPDVLPNGKGVVFTVRFNGRNGAKDRTSYAIAVAAIPSGKHRVILDDAMYARYATSGHLLYVTANKTLMVVPFDQSSMRVTGEPTVLAEGLRVGEFGSADLSVSAEGTLIYATGEDQGKQELVWVTRDGKVQPVDPDWSGVYLGFPVLSPDGKQVAVARSSSAELMKIWIKRLDRGPSIKLTGGGKESFSPAWTPDGRSVTFSSTPVTGSIDLWTERADGGAPSAMQVRAKRNLYSAGWSADGKWLIFQTDVTSPGSGDILAIRPGIDTAPVPLLATTFTEISPALSPDGRWLSYTSNETGDNEIYVVPFPNVAAGKWAISRGGGTEPLWSHSGSELFYRDASGSLIAVRVNTKPIFSVGRSTPLFPAGGFTSLRSTPQYAVAPGDRRFLMIRPLATGTQDKLIVVENWFDELKAKSR